MEQLRIAEEILKTGGCSPHDLADLKGKLSAEYSFTLGQLELVLARKPLIWNEMRDKHKSDKQADKEYEATTDGIDEMGLRLRAKRAERLLGAIGSMLRLAENEAKHLM